ncbi:MAG: C1 family peptidase [Anaerolineae bacterium]
MPGRASSLIRALIFALLLALLVATGTVAEAPFQETQPPEEIGLSEKDASSEVVLRENQVLVLHLEAKPSTGYEWVPTDFDASVLAQDLVSTPQYEGLSERLGAPARQLIRFYCIGAGRSALSLAYWRPWQRNIPPRKVFSVTVECLAPLRPDLIPAPTSAPPPLPQETPELDIGALSLPSHFNWCETYPCPSIRDQGECGACWAFGTVGVLEIAIRIKDGVLRNLSEQYLLSCNTDGWDCNGGQWVHDYHWWKMGRNQTAAGAVYESDFPYRGWEVPCTTAYAHHEKISGWSYVTGAEEAIPTNSALKQAIYAYGPVATTVCAGSAFRNYSGGIFGTNESGTCMQYPVNHGVVLTGWDDGAGIWYLRNSWGTDWGESGWMRIRYGTSRIGYNATYISYGSAPPPTPEPTTPPPTPSVRRLYLPVISRAPLSLLNGDFEQGRTAWYEYSSHGWQLIVPRSALPGSVSPHSGNWVVWLGGDYNDISFIRQQVTIPTGNHYLHYWHWIASKDACGYDFGGVVINDTVVDMYDLCTSRNTNGWVRHTVNLSSYAGQTVFLQIRAETDGSLNSNLFVDDVSFQSWGAAGTEEVMPLGETVSAESAAKSEASGMMRAAGVARDQPRLLPTPSSSEKH